MYQEIFIDESSQTKHRFLILGGIIGRVPEAALNSHLSAVRRPELPFGELGWVKVSRSKLAAYTRFVDAFFVGEIGGHMDFHCIVIDTHRIDEAAYNQGSRSAGFDKEIYQLLMKFGRQYRQPISTCISTEGAPKEICSVAGHCEPRHDEACAGEGLACTETPLQRLSRLPGDATGGPIFGRDRISH